MVIFRTSPIEDTAMSPDLPLTNRDRRLLQKHRLNRFRSFFPNSLKPSLLELGTKNHLSIHCAEAWMVDDLLSEIDRLRWYTWMVLGVSQVAICFAHEEIYSTGTLCFLEAA